MIVGNLELNLLLNRTNFDRTLREAERDARLFGNTKVTIEPEVDTRAVKGISTAVKNEFNYLDQWLKLNPIKPRVDLSELQRASSFELVVRSSHQPSATSYKPQATSLNDDCCEDITRSIADNTAPIKELLGEIADNTKKPGLIQSGLRSVIGNTFGATLQGGFMKLGMQFATQVTKEASKGEKGKQATEATARVAARVGNIGVNASANYAEILFGAAKSKGNPIETMMNDILTGIENIVDPVLLDQKVVQVRRKLFDVMTKVESSSLSIAQVLAETVTAIHAVAPRQINNAAYRTAQVASAPFKIQKEYQNYQAARLVENFVSNIERPTRLLAKNPESQAIAEAEQVGIVIGGHERKKGASSQQTSEMLRPFFDEKTAFLEVKNTYTDRYNEDPQSSTYELLKGILEPFGISMTGEHKSMLSNLEIELQSVFKGMNPDAIKAEIINASIKALFPDKEVFYVGFSGGAFPGEQATSISEARGDATKGAGIGAPFFGLTDTASPENFQSVIGYEDPLTFLYDKEFIEYPEKALKELVKQLVKKGFPADAINLPFMQPADNVELVEGKIRHDLQSYVGNDEAYDRLAAILPGMKPRNSNLDLNRISAATKAQYPEIIQDLEGMQDPLLGSGAVRKVMAKTARSNRFLDPKDLPEGLQGIENILNLPEEERSEKQQKIINKYIGDVTEQFLKNLAENEAQLNGLIEAEAKALAIALAKNKGIDSTVSSDFEPIREAVSKIVNEYFNETDFKKNLEANKKAALEVLNKAALEKLKAYNLNTENLQPLQKSALGSLISKRETEDASLLKGLDIYKNNGTSEIEAPKTFFDHDDPKGKLDFELQGYRDYVVEINAKELKGTQYEEVAVKFARLVENIQAALARFVATGEAIPEDFLAAAEKILSAKDKLANFEFPDLIASGELQPPSKYFKGLQEGAKRLSVNSGNEPSEYEIKQLEKFNQKIAKQNKKNPDNPIASVNIEDTVRLGTGWNGTAMLEQQTGRVIKFPAGDADPLTNAANTIERELPAAKPLVKAARGFIPQSRIEETLPKEAKNVEEAAKMQLASTPPHKQIEGFVVMQVEAGKAVAAAAQSLKGKDPQAIIDFIQGIIEAGKLISQFHEQGYKHGDLHLNNVIAREDGSYAPIDFGTMEELPKDAKERKRAIATDVNKAVDNSRWLLEDKGISINPSLLRSAYSAGVRGEDTTASDIYEQYSDRLLNVFPKKVSSKKSVVSSEDETTNYQPPTTNLKTRPDNPLVTLQKDTNDKLDKIVSLLSGDPLANPIARPTVDIVKDARELDLVSVEEGSRLEALGTRNAPNLESSAYVLEAFSAEEGSRLEALGTRNAPNPEPKLDELFTVEGLRKLAPMTGLPVTTMAGDKPIKSAKKEDIVKAIATSAPHADIERAIASASADMFKKKYQDRGVIKPELTAQSYELFVRLNTDAIKEIEQMSLGIDIDEAIAKLERYQQMAKEVLLKNEFTPAQSQGKGAVLGGINQSKAALLAYKQFGDINDLIAKINAELGEGAIKADRHWGNTTTTVLQQFSLLAKEAKDKGYDIQRFISEGSPGPTEKIRKHWQTTEKALSANIEHIRQESKVAGSDIEKLFSANPDLSEDLEVISAWLTKIKQLTSTKTEMEIAANLALADEGALLDHLDDIFVDAEVILSLMSQGKNPNYDVTPQRTSEILNSTLFNPVDAQKEITKPEIAPPEIVLSEPKINPPEQAEIQQQVVQAVKETQAIAETVAQQVTPPKIFLPEPEVIAPDSIGSGGGQPPKPPKITATPPEPEDDGFDLEKIKKQAEERNKRIQALKDSLKRNLEEVQQTLPTPEPEVNSYVERYPLGQPFVSNTRPAWEKTARDLKAKFESIREEAKISGSEIEQAFAADPELLKTLDAMEAKLDTFRAALAQDYRLHVPFEAGDINTSQIEDSLTAVGENLGDIEMGVSPVVDADTATAGFTALNDRLSQIHSNSIDVRHLWQQIAEIASGWAQTMQGGGDPLGGLENVYEGYADAVNNLPNVDDIFSGVSDFISEMSEASPVFGKIVDFAKELGISALAIFGFSEFSDVLAEGFMSLVNYGREFQRFERAMSAAGKSGQQVFADLYDTSQKYGTSLKESMAGYTQLSLSTQGTDKEAVVDSIFPGFQKAFASRQATPEQQGRGFLAVEQMLSKGNASAEELRQQLSEALPGAFAIAAQAMGMDMQEFTVQLYSAQIASEELLTRMAAFYDKDSQILLEISGASFEAELNRVTNNMVHLQSVAGDIVIPLLTPALQLANTVLTLIGENAEIVSIIFAGVMAGSIWRSVQAMFAVANATKVTTVMVKLLGLESVRASTAMIAGMTKTQMAGVMLYNGLGRVAAGAKAMWAAFAAPTGIVAGLYLFYKLVTAGTQEVKAAAKVAKNIAKESGREADPDKDDNSFASPTFSGRKGQDFANIIKDPLRFLKDRTFLGVIDDVGNFRDKGNIGKSIEQSRITGRNVQKSLASVDLEQVGKNLSTNRSEQTLLDVERRLAIANSDYAKLAEIEQERAELKKQQEEELGKITGSISFLSKDLEQLGTQKEFLKEKLDKRFITQEAYDKLVADIDVEITKRTAQKDTVEQILEGTTTTISADFTNIQQELDNRLWTLSGELSQKSLDDMNAQLSGSISSLELEINTSLRTRDNAVGVAGATKVTADKQRARILNEETSLKQAALFELRLVSEKDFPEGLENYDFDKIFAQKLPQILNLDPDKFITPLAEGASESNNPALSSFLSGLAAYSQAADNAATASKDAAEATRDHVAALKDAGANYRDFGISIRDYARSREDFDLENKRFLEDFPLKVEDVERNINRSARGLEEQYDDFISSLDKNIAQTQLEIAQLDKQIKNTKLRNKVRSGFKLGSEGFGSDLADLYFDYMDSLESEEEVGLKKNIERMDIEEQIAQLSRQIRDLSEEREDLERDRLAQERDLMRELEDFTRQQRRTWEDLLEEERNLVLQAKELGVDLGLVSDGVYLEGINLVNALAEVTARMLEISDKLYIRAEQDKKPVSLPETKIDPFKPKAAPTLPSAAEEPPEEGLINKYLIRPVKEFFLGKPAEAAEVPSSEGRSSIDMSGFDNLRKDLGQDFEKQKPKPKPVIVAPKVPRIDLDPLDLVKTPGGKIVEKIFDEVNKATDKISTVKKVKDKVVDFYQDNAPKAVEVLQRSPVYKMGGSAIDAVKESEFGKGVSNIVDVVKTNNPIKGLDDYIENNSLFGDTYKDFKNGIRSLQRFNPFKRSSLDAPLNFAWGKENANQYASLDPFAQEAQSTDLTLDLVIPDMDSRQSEVDTKVKKQYELLDEKGSKTTESIGLENEGKRRSYLDSVARKLEEIDKYFIQQERDEQTQAYELTKQTANAKGYLTTSEQVKFAGGDVAQEYQNQIDSISDRLTAMEELSVDFQGFIYEFTGIEYKDDPEVKKQINAAIEAINDPELQKKLRSAMDSVTNLGGMIVGQKGNKSQYESNKDLATKVAEENKAIEIDFQNRADELGMRSEAMEIDKGIAPSFIHDLTFNKEARSLGEEQINLDYEKQLKDLDRVRESATKTGDTYDRMKKSLDKLNQAKLDKLHAETSSLVQIFDEVAQPALNGLLEDFIDNSVSASEAWSNFAQSILLSLSDILMAYAKNEILRMIFKKKADGGGLTAEGEEKEGGSTVQSVVDIGTSIASAFSQPKSKSLEPRAQSLEPKSNGWLTALSYAGQVASLFFSEGGDTEAMYIPYASHGLDTSDVALARGINEAMRREAHPQAFAAVLHKGEVVLSDLNGDAQLVRELRKSGEWNQMKGQGYQSQKVDNFRYGSEGAAMTRRGSGGDTIIYSSPITVNAKDANSFKLTQDQIYRRQRLMQERSKR